MEGNGQLNNLFEQNYLLKHWLKFQRSGRRSYCKSKKGSCERGVLEQCMESGEDMLE